jgi:hypothetical protein
VDNSGTGAAVVSIWAQDPRHRSFAAFYLPPAGGIRVLQPETAGISIMNEPDPLSLVQYRLWEVREGQILRLAGSSFAVVAKHRRHRLVHLDLEADDGAHATLIGVPGALVRLGEKATPNPL